MQWYMVSIFRKLTIQLEIFKKMNNQWKHGAIKVQLHLFLYLEETKEVFLEEEVISKVIHSWMWNFGGLASGTLKSRTWEKDLSVSNLLGRCSQEQGIETTGRMRKARKKIQGRVHSLLNRVAVWVNRASEVKSICLQCWRPGFDPWVRKIL